MGRGRPHKPAAIRKLEGNRSRTPIHDAPRPNPGAPECPGWLTGEARDEWLRVVPSLASIDMLDRMDRSTLAAYCEAWAQFCQASTRIKTEGAVYDVATKHGVLKRKSPWVDVRADATQRLLKIATEYGMTPQSRAKLGAFQGVDVRDELDAFAKPRIADTGTTAAG